MNNDWKSFYLQHPWFPPRLLKDKFGIKGYDIDNWKRVHPHVRTILDQEKWKLSRSMSVERAKQVLTAAWKYYLEEEKKINLKDESAAVALIQLKGISRSGFGFLLDAHYLSLFRGYKKWLDQGFTATSFALSHIYPGAAEIQEMGILPAMFFQTHAKAIERSDLLALIEHIYIRHIHGVMADADQQQIDKAKRVFYARHREQSFLTSSMLRTYGVGVNMSPHGLRDAIEGVARKFGEDLGLAVSVGRNDWSAAEYRRRFPVLQTGKCKYCGRIPIDLHHLLDRSNYPELIYSEDNVIPLCVMVHAAITRGSMSAEYAPFYKHAAGDWRRRPDGSRAAAFDDVMRRMHESIYGEV